MTITVKLPSGQTLNFPDGTASDVLKSAVAKFQGTNLAPSPKPEDTPQPEAPALKPSQDVSVPADMAKSFGAGLVRGGMGLVGLPGLAEGLGRKGINAIGGNVSPETVLPGYRDIEKTVEGTVGPLHKPQTTAGEYAGTIGEFAPGVLFPVAGAASRAGQIAARVGGGVVAPAVASETAGQLTKGTSAEPMARLVGALGGGLAASRAISPVRGSADPEHLHQVNVLRAEGVQPSAAQATNSRSLKWVEQSAQDVPFGPGLRHADRRAEQFTRAVLRRAGINAPRATDDVLNAAFDRIGNVFDTVGQNAVLTRNARSDRALNGLVGNVNEYLSNSSQMSRIPAIEQMAAEIAQTYRFGTITGQQYTTWRSQMSRRAREMKAAPEAQRAMNNMVQSLDALMAPALSAPARQSLRQARRDYRNLLVIEKAALGAGENAAKGLLSPTALKNAVRQQNPRAYARGQGDFAQLARAGEAVLRELPQSGTAPRAVAMGLLGVGGGTVGGPGGFLAATAGPAISARIMTNPTVQRYLSNRTGTAINPRASAMASIPGAVTDAGQAQPLRGSVGPGDRPLSEEEKRMLLQELSR